MDKRQLSGSLFTDHPCGKDKIPSQTLQILQEHSDEVWFLQFSHNGKYLASSSSDCLVIIWEADGQRIVASGDGKGKSLVRVFIWRRNGARCAVPRSRRISFHAYYYRGGRYKCTSPETVINTPSMLYQRGKEDIKEIRSNETFHPNDPEPIPSLSPLFPIVISSDNKDVNPVIVPILFQNLDEVASKSSLSPNNIFDDMFDDMMWYEDSSDEDEWWANVAPQGIIINSDDFDDDSAGQSSTIDNE